jgi:6-phosphogluconolactonase
MHDHNKDRLVYVGTYTHKGTSEGTYIYRLDMTTGVLTSAGVGGGASNPSFLALDPQHQYLYAAGWRSECVCG